MEHYYNRIEDANDKQIPNSFVVNPHHGSIVAANWTQGLQGVEGGREGQTGQTQTEPIPCVYGVSSIVLIGKPRFQFQVLLVIQGDLMGCYTGNGGKLSNS